MNPPQFARDLRRAIGFNGNVLVLSQAPRSLGIASSLPEGEIQDIFNRSVDDLRADPIGGTIALGQRLSGAGEGEGAGGSSDDRGWGSAPVVVPLMLVGTVGVIALTRAVGPAAGHGRASPSGGRLWSR